MTTLADRLKRLKEAMTPGPWRRVGFEVRHGGGNKRVATAHLAYKSSAETEANATVIALGDLFIPVVMALEQLLAEALLDERNAVSKQARALRAQIEERLTR